MKRVLLRIEEVAELLGISEGTVRNLVKKKLLPPPHKVLGRLARWFASDVRAYLRLLREDKG